MLKTGKCKNYVFSFSARACKSCRVNVNVHMTTLQLLVNQECNVRQQILAFRRNSLDLLSTTRATTCTLRNCTTNKHFHAFLEFFVILLGKNKTLLARFVLTSSKIRVLGLANYTTANDIVVLLLL